jgi:hypothetical protein
MRRRVGVALLMASIVGAVPGWAQESEFSADSLESSEGPEEGGALRLGLWGPVFSTVTAKSDSGGTEVENRTSSFGLPAQGAGFGIGYAPNRIVGFGVDLSAASQDNELLIDGESQGRLMTSSWALSPYFDVLFSEASMVRPFVRGQVGFGGITTTSSDPTGTMSEVEDEVSIFRLAAGLGVYIFPIEQLSVDARLDVAYVGLTQTPAGSTEELEASGVGAIFVVGFSGWFGRSDPQPAISSVDAEGTEPGALTGQPTSNEPEQEPDRKLSGGGRASLDGERGIRVTLAGNVILRLDYPTEAGAESVTAVVLVPESVATGADCSMLEYFYNDGDLEQLSIAPSALMRGSEKVTVFDGELSTETLARLAKRRKAKSGFHVCEHSLELVEDQRAAIRDFLRRSR